MAFVSTRARAGRASRRQPIDRPQCPPGLKGLLRIFDATIARDDSSSDDDWSTLPLSPPRTWVDSGRHVAKILLPSQAGQPSPSPTHAGVAELADALA
jgi:hypothetical protein